MSSFMSTGITFGQFAGLAKKNGFTESSLIDIGKSWWEGHDPLASFAKRVFTPMHKDVVIPYRPLLELATRWQAIETEKKEKVCACGCGKPLVGQFRRYASAACKQRHFREAH